MTKSIQAPKLSLHLKRTAFALAAAWTAVIVLVACWHLLEVYENTLESARIQASRSFEKDLVYRRWAAGHGGVYVPPTEETPPNPDLSHMENRDVTTTSGLHLTLVNPAYMTRQVHELGRAQYGHQAHITSLKPLRAENAPDAWQAEALRAFERGKTEVVEVARIGDTEYLRLMRPLITEAGCLKCHAAQGYKEGDLRGGISVAVPMAPLWTLMHGYMVGVTMGYGLIWLLGLAGIGLGASRTSRHIRERDRAEEALRESQGRLLRAQRVARMGFLDWDLKTNEMYWSDEIYDLYGIDWEGTKADIDLTMGLVHPDDMEYVQENLDLAIRGVKRYDIDHRKLRPDGEVIWVHAQADLALDADGNPESLLGTVVDITKRKRAEEEVESLARFPSENPNPVLRVDRHGRLLYANEATFSLLLGWQLQVGQAVPEVLQKLTQETEEQGVGTVDIPCGERVVSIAASDSPEGGYVNVYARDITDRKRAEEEVESLARFPSENPNPVLRVDRHGRLLYANEAAFSLLLGWQLQVGQTVPEVLQKLIQETEEQGVRTVDIPCGERVVSVAASDSPEGGYVNVYARDITERTRAEQALSESEEKHRLLFESSRDAIMTLAPPSWRFTSCNPATVQMFGVQDEADFVSRAPWEYSRPSQPDGRPSEGKAREMIETAMREGSRLFEWRHKRLDGEEFPATVLLTRFELAGQALLQATVRDVSARERLEEQLRQSHKMEAVGRLAGGVAHDFNNVLMGISGFTEFAMDAAPADSTMREDLAEVLTLAERAADLTRQLLAFSRRQTLQPVVLDVNQLVGNMAKMLKRLIGEDIDLVFVPAEDLGSVKADRGQTEQVVMNLAVNARDVMPDGGKLTIETANVTLDEEYARTHEDVTPGAYVMLAVTDTGCGMDEETRQRMFEPFFTTKEQGQGTGLGLATVYGIVKQHGGSIWVYSEPGKGTSFKVYLPRVEEADVAEAIAAPAESLSGTETVLVVEDEAAVREIVERMLQARGYRILTEGTPAEADAMLAEHGAEIALLLTDVVLPDGNGRQIYESTRDAYPDLRVLYMSGYTDNAIAHHGVLDPGTAFIGKPFTPDALARKVREALGGPPGDS